ncbi:prephenate dehydrogenase [Branchiibius hedensis]|uniref:Prephenate dehydrogenase n=1 Tax=Branchiibius hedensis TaxID=672460 RepID=A0A2Y8ZQX2_9MICO|nr:prephenate dehydrogenase [Branchiibius hedensis]PWJ25001.1 prephenate dehydrogenase [Branchiibius hedensis]SSA33816.1 prephenate dehydrogenase [Branchiibius hedensis]
MKVHVIGTGLIGTSIALALTRVGDEVTLEDPSPTAAALAADLGAGSVARPEHPDVVVVAAPPDVTAKVVELALVTWPLAVVTDVASVKGAILADLVAYGEADLSRYVGSHPMAGKERSGAVAAQADLFEGRTWVVCPATQSAPSAVDLVARLAAATGAAVVQMPAGEHDAAVAAVSHVPQLAASLVAARLRELPDGAIALSGQGIRDVTRIAASDPLLWTQILSGNAAAIAPVIDDLADDLSRVAEALRALLADDDGTGARGVLARAIADGQLGQARIPGKHGSAPTAYAALTVIVPDEPGSLARLFNDMGDAGINLEDLRLEHGVGAKIGLAEVMVLPTVADRLRGVLEEKGWRVHD